MAGVKIVTFVSIFHAVCPSGNRNSLVEAISLPVLRHFFASLFQFPIYVMG